ncbi:hypothetical protein DSO57_1024536 [Entomophthora muscae]|uniref:Uncharacterized protein n=1 Tax=Entomophthora muscae TaxID=34485 RepID=A0ACC2UCR7_9FUNG|nr:hypothetical protein DSO57_1024536 [Entomophthora muscae]
MNEDEFKPHPSPTQETHRPELDSSASWRSRGSPREASFSEYDVRPSTPRGSSGKGSPGKPVHRIENRSNSSGGFYRHPPSSAQRRSYTTPTRISRHFENHSQSCYRPPKSAGASSPLQSRTSFTCQDSLPTQHQTKRSIRQPSPIHF